MGARALLNKNSPAAIDCGPVELSAVDHACYGEFAPPATASFNVQICIHAMGHCGCLLSGHVCRNQHG